MGETQSNEGMPKRPTPITDAEEARSFKGLCNISLAFDFARRLERQLADTREQLSNLTHLNAREMLAIESSLREAESQRDALVDAVERVLPYLPEMEPIGAAAHSEHNRASWDLRQLMRSIDRKEIFHG